MVQLCCTVFVVEKIILKKYYKYRAHSWNQIFFLLPWDGISVRFQDPQFLLIMEYLYTKIIALHTCPSNAATLAVLMMTPRCPSASGAFLPIIPAARRITLNVPIRFTWKLKLIVGIYLRQSLNAIVKILLSNKEGLRRHWKNYQKPANYSLEFKLIHIHY